MDKKSYIKSLFGESVTVTPIQIPKNAPYYLVDNYTARKLNWDGNECVILTPSDSDIRLSTMKKHYRQFQSNYFDFPCALELNFITSSQRSNLIKEKIPFICENRQVFLPFWGCLFTEAFNHDAPVPKSFAPGTQLVFLYLYYRYDELPVTQTQICSSLRIPKATCSRAVRDLQKLDLIEEKADKTAKWISCKDSREDFLNKGFVYMKSPVSRTLYTT